jgi:predicted Zn-dependent protease
VGDGAKAEEVAEALRATAPGSADAQAIAGDVQLLNGTAPAALERYRLSARVRVSSSLLQRMAVALDRSGQRAEADGLVASYLAASPRDAVLVRLMAERGGTRPPELASAPAR